MKKIAISILIIVLILSGCSSSNPSTSSANDNPLTIVAVTKQVSETPSTNETPSVTETPTPNVSGQFHVDEKCPVVEDNIPNGFDIGETLILSSSPSNLFMLTPSSGTERQVKDADIQMGAGSVSPDGKVLAYATGNWKEQLFFLVFSDSNNNLLKTIPWKDDWYLIGNWVNSNQLAILAYNQKLVLISPYTDQMEIISTMEMGFPDYSNYNLGRPWVLFSPNMKKAAYTEYNQEIVSDVQDKKEMMVIPRYAFELIEADWSNDGLFVAVVAQNPKFTNTHNTSYEEVYILTQDGLETQVTNFAEFYRSGVLIYNPSWSPDGSFVAFWIHNESYGDPYYRLAVFNLGTRTATVYCLSSNLSRGIHTKWYAAPIWSPDSNQILIESNHGDTDSAVIILDITTNEAVKISENSQPVGWMSP
jgi:Tol biopolymer transport system component